MKNKLLKVLDHSAWVKLIVSLSLNKEKVKTSLQYTFSTGKNILLRHVAFPMLMAASISYY